MKSMWKVEEVEDNQKTTSASEDTAFIEVKRFYSVRPYFT